MITFRVLIVVALQTLALAYMIFDRQQMLDSARVVTLKVVPVDPRDIFRGDYVVLNYEISRLDLKTLQGEDKFLSGETAFVTLQQQGAEWKAVGLSHSGQPVIQGATVIKATVTYSEELSGEGPVFISLQYGIESYFVPQGTGHEIEKQAQAGKLTADIAIDEKGRGAIKALRSDGKIFHVEGVF